MTGLIRTDRSARSGFSGVRSIRRGAKDLRRRAAIDDQADVGGDREEQAFPESPLRPPARPGHHGQDRRDQDPGSPRLPGRPGGGRRNISRFRPVIGSRPARLGPIASPKRGTVVKETAANRHPKQPDQNWVRSGQAGNRDRARHWLRSVFRSDPPEVGFVPLRGCLACGFGSGFRSGFPSDPARIGFVSFRRCFQMGLGIGFVPSDGADPARLASFCPGGAS